MGWFGANMAGLRNKNVFKFILQVFILSQKHILGVKKVVWCGLDVVWGGLEVVWGVLGWFGVFPRTGRSTATRNCYKLFSTDYAAQQTKYVQKHILNEQE